MRIEFLYIFTWELCLLILKTWSPSICFHSKCRKVFPEISNFLYILQTWHIYVSPSNEGRHIVLVWFFLPLLLPLFLLLLSEACPDHNFFVSDIGQLYLVCGCMTIRRCVAYRNDLCGTLTSMSNNCFLNSIFLSGP